MRIGRDNGTLTSDRNAESIIPFESVGADVPYAYGADCLSQDAVSKASLIGTDFKFTKDFKNSFAVGYSSNIGSAQERSQLKL